MAILIDTGETYMAIKLALDLHYIFISRMSWKAKHMSVTWTNWDTRKGSPCFEVMLTLRYDMPEEWPVEAVWRM
jgi:hypothetical protein